MIEQSLQISQQQRLQMILAPQLRQSLQLLQVPILELRTLVQQELQQNPTLEEKIQSETSLDAPEEKETESAEDNAELDFKEEFDVLAKLDEEWREYFQQDQALHPYTAEQAARRKFMFDSITINESLQEHLLKQLALTNLNEEDRKIGELIIGSINDDGYLTTGINELAESTGHQPEYIRRLLLVIQDFDPVGVGAADLRECLLLQLRRLGKEDSLAAEIVRHHLDKLGSRKYPQIAKALKVSQEEVREAARFIATLEPRPGRMYSSETAAYVLPEVIVEKSDGEYIVILNNEHLPHLRISRNYRRMLDDPDTPEHVKKYIREKIRAGAFLIKSINQRQHTIYRIAHEIVGVQKEFLDHGVQHLKPLTMAQVAAVLGIHETTVSRAIANKYMQTPRGTFEMKFFFSPGYKTADGKEVSNKTIKDAIARLVAEEDPANPLSDQAMAEELQRQGIRVARRTIAKYREELHILPSHLRKSY